MAAATSKSLLTAITARVDPASHLPTVLPTTSVCHTADAAVSRGVGAPVTHGIGLFTLWTSPQSV